jgi:hypothetical protein
VWIIENAPRASSNMNSNESKRKGRAKGQDDRRQHFERVSKAATKYLTTRTFATTADCIAALKVDKREIWVTSVARNAVSTDQIPR